MKRLPLLAGLALAMLSACARLPEAGLAAFSDAHVRAEEAGNLLLDEVAPLVAAAEGADEPCAIDPAQGFRPCFSVALALAGPDERPADPPTIRLRRTALGLVGTYGRLLSETAEGRSAAVLEARVAEFGRLAARAAALVPGLQGGAAAIGLATGPFAALAGRAEAMRAAGAAAASVLEAEADVAALIRLLRDDAPALYEVYVAQFVGERGDIRIALTEAKIDENAAEVARLEAVLAALSDPSAAANRARRFEAALTAYVRLLDRSERALAGLAAAARAPSEDPGAAALAIVEQATEARLFADALLGEIRALSAE